MKKSGKCTRCGRALKSVFVIDGQEYGPVCVTKMGGTPYATTVARQYGKDRAVAASDQMTIMELIDVEILVGN